MNKELNKASVEQAGGDERDLQAECAQEVPSPVSQEYDRHLINLLRKGEALPGHQEEAADEIERLRDWNDHLNNTVLPNILNPNLLMLMKGGERLLDLCTKDGKFIGVSLNDMNDMKDVFDWMVTHARIAPDHAALARVAEMEKQEPVAWVDVDWIAQVSDPRGDGCTVRRAYGSAGVGLVPLYAAPVAQAQHSVPELNQSRSALTEAQMRRLYDNSTEAENERLGFAAFARLMRRAEAVHQIAAAPAQAQHSVPDGLRELLEMLVVSDLRKIRYAGAWRREVHNRASSILALLAAAPGKEGV